MKKITIISALIIVAVGFNFLNSALSRPTVKKFHTEEEIAVYTGHARRAPIAAGEYFLPSSSCRGCHGYDSAHVSNIAESGADVNLVDRWESSMMANSARDPFWRAKVSQEITINPAHSGVLQNKCTDCHAPMGRYTSMLHGHPYYGLSDLETDSLGIDGVSCGSCHKIGPSTGFTFSGNIPYDTSMVEYGPFTAPSVGPMQLYEGFTPTYSPHMDNGKLCSACHTLITESVDLSGALTGGYFVEQATYHEFVNSSFPGNNIKCQTCHMPQNVDGIIIANGFLGLTPRVPFNQHVFAGANSFMLNVLKNNRDSLGIDVPTDKFDSTIVATMDMLQHKSINFTLSMDSINVDTAYFKVKLENKAGHKFPSGYPSRRAVLQFVAIDALGDTVFRSGLFDANKRVIGEPAAPSFEPHHNVINQTGVSQIYEIVPGDVNGHFTSVLERAANLLKDNRIPPAGFTTTHAVYDTTLISGDALADGDFNKNGLTEGTAIDYVHFHVPLVGVTGHLDIKTKVYYQSVPPKWTDEMFTLNTAPINKFKHMYQDADHTPVLVAKDSMNNVNLVTGINTNSASARVFPTVSMDGRVYVSSDYGTFITSIEILTAEGKLVSKIINSNYASDFTIDLPAAKGIYFLRIYSNNKIVYKKVVKS
jgi:hypothetical protein